MTMTVPSVNTKTKQKRIEPTPRSQWRTGCGIVQRTPSERRRNGLEPILFDLRKEQIVLVRQAYVVRPDLPDDPVALDAIWAFCFVVGHAA